MERIRRTVEHVGQAQIVSVLVKMAVMIAHKAYRTAADGIRLAVKDMNTGTVFNDHNFMKIMMMFGKRWLRKARFDRDRRYARGEKIRALQNSHSGSCTIQVSFLDSNEQPSVTP